MTDQTSAKGKQWEKDSKKSEGRLSDVLYTLGNGVIVISEKGKIKLFNRGADDSWLESEILEKKAPRPAS